MGLVRFVVGLSLLTLVFYLIYLFFLTMLNTPISVYLFSIASTVLIFVLWGANQKKEAEEKRLYKTKKDWIIGFSLTFLLVTLICVLGYDFLSGTSAPICNPDIQDCQDWDSNIP
jgi:hypothetical protein